MRIAPLPSEPSAIVERAVAQYTVLRRRLGELGVAVDELTLPTQHGLTAQVADLAVVTERGAVLMRPSALERLADVAVVEAVLVARGIPLLGRIEAPGLLDGADVLLAPGRAYIAVHSERRGEVAAAAAGRAQFAALTGLSCIDVPLHRSVLRLRSVAAFVDRELVVIGGDAIDPAIFADVEVLVLPVGEELAAGLFVLDRRRVVANLRFRESPALLRKARISLESLDLWEFGKVGIAPGGLVLPLERR